MDKMKLSVMLGGACALPPEAIGAIEILWFNIGKIFARNGHYVTLLGKGNQKIKRDEKNFSCHVFRGFSSGGRYVTLVRAFFACIHMFRMLKSCDVLVVNNVWAVFLSRFFKRKFKILVANIQRMPKVGFALRNRGADVYICPTNEVARRVRTKFGGGNNERIIVIPNPVDVSHFNIENRVKELGNKIIVYHGRINMEKGLHILAKAVAIIARSYSDIRLKLIGTYDIKKGGSGIAYKNELDILSNGRIDWVEAIVDRDKLAREISSGFVYCYPSIAENGETFGVAPLEAMSLGMPVVVSGLRCFEDFIKDEETGLVFNHRVNNPEGHLAEKILRVLSDSVLREKLSRNACLTARKFSTNRVAELMENAFNIALAEKGLL